MWCSSGRTLMTFLCLSKFLTLIITFHFYFYLLSDFISCTQTDTLLSTLRSIGTACCFALVISPFFSVGPSRGVTLCHVTFSPLGVMVPLFIVTASFPVDSSSPRDIIVFLKSRPSLFVWPSKWHPLRPLVVRVMMVNVFVYLRH